MKLFGLILASLLFLTPLQVRASGSNYGWFGPAKVGVFVSVNDPYDNYVSVNISVLEINVSDLRFSGLVAVKSVVLTFEKYSKVFYYNYSETVVFEWSGDDYNVSSIDLHLYFPLEPGSWHLNVTVVFIFVAIALFVVLTLDVPVSVSVSVNVPGTIGTELGGGINILWITIIALGVIIGVASGLLLARKIKS